MPSRLRPSLGLLAPLLVGAAVRLLFWSAMETSWNDAYDYALNARFIREGEWQGVSRFMYTFYSVVAAAVDVFVRDAVLAGELVSLASGISVVALAHGIARTLAGPIAAACAAWIAALHPRLVEYSTVGYTESLLTALVAGALLAATRHLVRRAPPPEGTATSRPEGPATAGRRGRADLVAAALLAVAFLVRNETLFYLPVFLVVLAAADGTTAGWPAAARRTGARLGVALLVAAVPTALVWAMLDTSPVFRKAGANVALGAVYDVEAMGEWQARIYAVDEEGRLVVPEAGPDELGPRDRARIYAANLLNLSRFYLLRLVFSPLLLAFAAVGLLGVRFREGALAAEALLLLAWLTPHLFYPLLVVQPQYLIQTLPVLAVWGGRGLAHSAALLGLSLRLSPPAAAATLAVGLLLVVAPLVGGTMLIARERVADRGPFARIAGRWIAANAPDETYMGSDTGLTYFSGNFEQVALPVGVDAAELPRVAAANDAGLVVVTTGDVESRAGLAPLLADEPPPIAGLRRELREEDGRGNVLVIYVLTTRPQPAATTGGTR